MRPQDEENRARSVQVPTLSKQLWVEEDRLPLALFVNHPLRSPNAQWVGGVSLGDRNLATFVHVQSLPHELREQVLTWLREAPKMQGL